MTTEEKAKVIYAHLANAYRDPENQIEPCARLILEQDGDLSNELAAMLIAMMEFVDKTTGGIAKEYSDLVGFTHLLNRVAIQTCKYE